MWLICDVKVKLDNYQRREACEICGKSKEMSPVVVLPIYTLLSGNRAKLSVSRSEWKEVVNFASIQKEYLGNKWEVQASSGKRLDYLLSFFGAEPHSLQNRSQY